jgi:hypothetical protein
VDLVELQQWAKLYKKVFPKEKREPKDSPNYHI